MKKTINRRLDPTQLDPRTERPTLRTCDVCAGHGNTEKESSDLGTYSFKECIWCNGIGYYTQERQRAFLRWRRILLHNQRNGSCL